MMPHHLSLCNLAGMLSRGLQEAEEPRPHLTTLPDPLLRQITYLLDRQTTIALASTCLPVRDPAECSAWKDLNISVQRVLIPGPTRYDDSRPLGGNRLHTIHHMAIFGKNMSGGEGAASPRGAMDRYIRSLCVLLEGHTSWLKSVKAIYLDVDWLLSFETARLLSLVSGTLTWLELIPHIIYTPANPGPKPCCTLRNLFGGLDSKLKNLRHLQLPLDENWASTVVAVLEKTPNLRSLCLIPADAYSGGWGEPMRYNEPPKDAVWPLLPLLCKLEVNEMNIVLVPMLIAIIKSARSLEHVRTRGPIRCWLPVKGDELISELGNLKKLNYLGVSAECKEAIIATKAFSSLEQLSMVHDQTPWDAPQLEVSLDELNASLS